MKLRVSTDLTLPEDAVTQTFVVFGKRGSGKSNTAVVLAEEIHRAGGQIVVLDPVGAWWGLKSSFDGQGAGLPVYIFGGTHGDLPLRPTEGQLMAQVAIAHRIPMVLDMTGWSGADRARFVTAFATWLLGHNDRTPVHVFLEEADAFIPQRPYKGEEAMLGAMDRLIRWGRQEGIGATAITQRSAKINKDVTTQAEVLIAHRTIGPQDVAAIREWIKHHAAGDEQAEILSTLPTLPDGTAWVWSPDWLDLLRQVPFRRRETFDSASTPKLGEKRVQPKALAPVDLDALREQLSSTIDEAKANDPAELRRRIADLERTIADLEARPPETVERVVEVPVLNGQADRLGEVLAAAEPLAQLVEAAAGRFTAAAMDVRAVGAGILDAIASATTPTPRGGVNPPPRTPAPPAAPPPPPRRIAPPATAASAPRMVPGADAGTVALGRAERQVLQALANHPTGLSRQQLAFLAEYHPNAKGYTNALGSLRSAGFIDPGFPARITEAGLAVAPVAEFRGDVVGLYMARFGRAERAILEHLLAIYPGSAERPDLARLAGYEHPNSKGFTNALGRLRGLGLVAGFAVHPDFAALAGRA